jgi:hypothetical protein
LFIIEYYERTKWRPIKRTLNVSKKETQELLDEMNNSVDPETIKFLPVKQKYRIKKVKNNFLDKEEKNE